MLSTEEIEYIRKKYDEVSDPESEYSAEDFNKEFESVTGPMSDIGHKLSVKLINNSNNEDPTFATVGSSGFDIRANLDEPLMLGFGERAIIPTGLFFAIPESLELQIRSRSGLSAKNGVMVLNSPGTVDSDYRGEVKVILINLGNEIFKVNHGDRIAQGVIAPVMSSNLVNFEKVSSLDITKRNDGGFGSTGVK